MITRTKELVSFLNLINVCFGQHFVYSQFQCFASDQSHFLLCALAGHITHPPFWGRREGGGEQEEWKRRRADLQEDIYKQYCSKTAGICVWSQKCHLLPGDVHGAEEHKRLKWR